MKRFIFMTHNWYDLANLYSYKDNQLHGYSTSEESETWTILDKRIEYLHSAYQIRLKIVLIFSGPKVDRNL